VHTERLQQFPTAVLPILQYLGLYLARDPILFAKLCRLTRVHLSAAVLPKLQQTRAAAAAAGTLTAEDGAAPAPLPSDPSELSLDELYLATRDMTVSAAVSRAARDRSTCDCCAPDLSHVCCLSWLTAGRSTV